LYIGAEYCPFCAAQRCRPSSRSVDSARGRTGQHDECGEGLVPEYATFTFVRAVYKSKYLTFKSVEEYTNQIDAAGNNYVSLQNPTAAEQKLILKYDTAKYIPGLTSASGNPFPL